MAPVSPLVASPSASRGSDETGVAYELAPVQQLPTVDLSISIRSRLLSRSACELVNRFMRKWRIVLNVGYTIGLISVPVIMAAPIRVGSIVSCITVIISLPGALLGPTLLRYELLRLLVHTYDFWFFFVLVITTFTALGGILGPWRGISVSISVLGALTNVVVDANMRVPKSWVLYSSIAVSLHLVTVILTSLELIDGMHRFMILRVRDHVLPATTFASNGLLTICSLLARSVYRRREAVAFHSSTATATTVRCVGYRTLLCFTTATQRIRTVVSPSSKDIPSLSTSRSTIQQLHHDPLIGPIDASKTVLWVAFGGLLKVTPTHSRLLKWIHSLGLASIIVAFLTELSAFARHHESQQWVLSLALATTSAYCLPFAMCYHRQLLAKLVKSFDFVFLAAQITFTHACVCDFFRWTPRSILLVTTSWIWIHWVLCIDALTPIVRSRLGFHVRIAAPALTQCVLGSIVLVAAIVFSPSVVVFDRTLWSGIMFGHHVQFRLMPLFYNCFFTTFAMMLRILWRVFTISNETLFVLDGVVAYENCLERREKAIVNHRSLRPRNQLL